MPSPEVVASVVATHASTKTLRESFMTYKMFPVALVQPGYVFLNQNTFRRFRKLLSVMKIIISSQLFKCCESRRLCKAFTMQESTRMLQHVCPLQPSPSRSPHENSRNSSHGPLCSTGLNQIAKIFSNLENIILRCSQLVLNTS